MGGNYVFDRFLEKGRQEEARENIQRILRHKFGITGGDVSGRLAAISSRSALEALIDDALAAATLEEFLRRLAVTAGAATA